MESADARQSDDLATPRGSVGGDSPSGCLLPETQVSPIVVIIGDVLLEETTEMALAEDNDVIQDLATHASNPALGDGVLPWTSG
jgi:hypothetical protein